MIEFTTDPELAVALDRDDPLARFRDEFELPGRPAGADDAIYFVGNSLGPLPRRTRDQVIGELDRWSSLGVHGHFGDGGWVDQHVGLAPGLARLVGAHPAEVTAMNALTVNLHLLLVSFYRPTPERHRVLIEKGAFPSDRFAVESQMRWHGLDPAASLMVVEPADGGELLSEADIRNAIETAGDELALVLLPGVQYYTGQVMPFEATVAAARSVGATVGFDCAHAVGNVELKLHDWDVDFATWCSYKYVNASPGGASGIYVHERHLGDQSLPKLLGWWGTRLETRFEMGEVFEPAPTADSWQISNTATLPIAALRAALEVFDEAGGMAPLRAKSVQLTGYLQFLIDELLAGRVTSITPREPERRGCQLSLEITDPDVDGRRVFDTLEAAGVFCDWRHPNVIRVAPAPLFNTFVEVRRFVDLLDGAIESAR